MDILCDQVWMVAYAPPLYGVTFGGQASVGAAG